MNRYEEAAAKYSEALGLMPEMDPDDDDEIEAGTRSVRAPIVHPSSALVNAKDLCPLCAQGPTDSRSCQLRS